VTAKARATSAPTTTSTRTLAKATQSGAFSGHQMAATRRAGDTNVACAVCLGRHRSLAPHAKPGMCRKLAQGLRPRSRARQLLQAAAQRSVPVHWRRSCRWRRSAGWCRDSILIGLESYRTGQSRHRFWQADALLNPMRQLQALGRKKRAKCSDANFTEEPHIEYVASWLCQHNI
jgi:hypothetical protein